MKKLAVLLLALSALAASAQEAAAPAAPATPAATSAEAEMAAFRAAFAGGLRALYVDQLKLTEAEGKQFWPIYDAYAAGVKANNDKVLALIKRYADAYNKGPVDAATAKSLLTEAMALDKAEYKLRDDVMKKAMKVMPANKVALFYQMDSKVRATVKYDLAAQIPMIE